ncbi:MAG TPA: DUF1203 domain-containing protein [Vicinamibacteria bacterium]|nr:DUF1203 domain-containing protein [Vicinamibacteria bacterium]
MARYHVVALLQQIADEVRHSLQAPGYGHPAHMEVATGHGPCRLCLQTFRKGEEERLLFTYNPFRHDAEVPCPGPVFVHKAPCARYERSEFPSGLRGLPMTLEGYDHTGMAVLRVRLAGDPDRLVEDVLSRPQVAYAHIRNTEAGCFIARVERTPSTPRRVARE